MSEAVSDLVPGLFGKLPAHGDFVDRGWPAETVAALDEWLTGGVAHVRGRHDDDEAFAGRLSAAPMWHAYLAPGWAGPHALHLALAPSIDKAGRYFFLTAGVAGPPDAVWAVAAQQPGFGAALDTVMYDALGGGVDADAMRGIIADAADAPSPRARMLAAAALPAGSAWWTGEVEDGEPVLLRHARADDALIDLLLDGGAA